MLEYVSEFFREKERMNVGIELKFLEKLSYIMLHRFEAEV